jgi:hypothetical protein
MASAKQIAANRANAQRSTGPKTALGKLKSSRNSFQHGLSWPLPRDLATSSKIDAIAQVLTPQGASTEQLSSAVEFAEAQVELLRIRAIRNGMLVSIEMSGINTRQLRRLAALDRYERYGHTKRRRASAKL